MILDDAYLEEAPRLLPEEAVAIQRAHHRRHQPRLVRPGPFGHTRAHIAPATRQAVEAQGLTDLAADQVSTQVLALRGSRHGNRTSSSSQRRK